MKALEAAAWLVFLVIAGAVLGAGYLVWRLVESTVASVPPVAFQIAGGAGLFAFCLGNVLVAGLPGSGKSELLASKAWTRLTGSGSATKQRTC